MDMHTHSTVSDGTCSPLELYRKAKQAGISLFSLTDHDSAEGCAAIIEEIGRDRGTLVRFAAGIEFSCRDVLGGCHILGYCFRLSDGPVAELSREVGMKRKRKLEGRIRYLRESHGIILPKESVNELRSLKNPGKPHIANLLVSMGYAATREEAIARYLRGFPEAEPLISPDEAILAILGSGGVPVLAHPYFGDGEENLSEEELTERIARLRDIGLAGLECFYSGHSLKMTERLLEIAEERGLAASAGSDFHGTNKNIALGDNGFDGRRISHPAVRHFLDLIGDGIYGSF